MQQTKTINGIKCADCGYQGAFKSNNSLLFLIFVGIVFLSAYFLPLIIVALAYLVWILSKPNQKTCPECKSLNVEETSMEVNTVKSTSKTEPGKSQN